jgi:hypothetical protein
LFACSISDFGKNFHALFWATACSLEFFFAAFYGRLVPNATEQAALARARALREEGQSLRKIADTLASEFDLKKLDATSVKRILDRA